MIVNEETIDFNSFTQEVINKLPDSLLSSKQYILLKNKEKELAFNRIDKLILHGDKILLSDTRMEVLFVYGMDGNAITRVGKRGQGPNEYINMTDFDVDSSGRVFTLDARLDKLFIYNSSYDVITSFKVPFEAQNIKCLPGGDLLFGLSSWNGGVDGYMVVKTDSNLTIKEYIVPTSDFLDFNYLVAGYSFTRVNNVIQYNRQLENDVYQFTQDGTIDKVITIDFGKQNLPNEFRKDIESNLIHFDNYLCLLQFAVITDKYIVGSLLRDKKKQGFIVDRFSQVCYLNPIVPLYIKGDMFGFQDKTILSYFSMDNVEENSEMYNDLPQDVRSHLKEGNFVLCLQKFKV